jgi:hypothetical protein
MSTATATVTDIGKALEERINAIIESGHLTYDDDDVTTECARRYVDAEHRRYARNASRDVEQSAKVSAERMAKHVARTRALIAPVVMKISKGLIPEWSADLLASSFALKGGVQVSFGFATFDQHKERALAMEGLAAGDLHTAAIHRQAMHDIEAGGVATLAELLS